MSSGLADGKRTMFRRLKIRLGSLSWEQIERAIAEDIPIVAKVKTSDQGGGPVCGSARDNIEWEL